MRKEELKKLIASFTSEDYYKNVDCGNPFPKTEKLSKEQKIEEYITKTKSSALSEKDLARGKRVMLADFIKNFDSTENIANNLFSFICDGSEEYFLSFTDILSNIELDDIKELLEDIFKTEYRTISIVRPIS